MLKEAEYTADDTTQGVDRLYSFTEYPCSPQMYIFSPSGLKIKSVALTSCAETEKDTLS